jgi:hypothetical protein
MSFIINVIVCQEVWQFVALGKQYLQVNFCHEMQLLYHKFNNPLQCTVYSLYISHIVQEQNSKNQKLRV